MKRSIMLLLAAASVFSGCTNDSTSDLIDTTPVEGKITYQQHVKSIIENNCIRCHADVPQNGAPMPLTTYAAVKEAVLNRGLLNRISRQNGEEGLMPFGGPRMPQPNIDIIAGWGNDGLLEQ